MGSEPDIPALFVRSDGVSRLMRRQEHPQRENDLLSEHSQGTGGEGMGKKKGIFFFFFLSFCGGILERAVCSAYLPCSSAPHEISLHGHLEPAFHRRRIASRCVMRGRRGREGGEKEEKEEKEKEEVVVVEGEEG